MILNIPLCQNTRNRGKPQTLARIWKKQFLASWREKRIWGSNFSGSSLYWVGSQLSPRLALEFSFLGCAESVNIVHMLSRILLLSPLLFFLSLGVYDFNNDVYCTFNEVSRVSKMRCRCTFCHLHLETIIVFLDQRIIACPLQSSRMYVNYLSGR